MAIFSTILPDFHGYILKSAGVQLRFIRLAGSGAYGVVYLAHDLSTPELNPRTYAVKCMLKFDPKTELAAHQAREIAFHKSLAHHPHIAKLHHVIEEEHYLFLVMDYYDGGDLFSAVVDRQSFARNNYMVKLAFLQLLDAVQACHELGIFHRDLKPENILCSCEDTRLFLADFGLATQSTVSEAFGCGSSYYMSPECVGSTDTRVPYSTRESDVWSLGVILTNLLTGRNPWHIAAAAHDEGYAVYLDEGVQFLHHLLPISAEAAALLAKVFDPTPSSRITLAELRKAVTAVTSFFPREGEGEDSTHFAAHGTGEVCIDQTPTDVTLNMSGSDNSSRTACTSDELVTDIPSVDFSAGSFVKDACLAFDRTEAELTLALRLHLPQNTTHVSPLAPVAGEHGGKSHLRHLKGLASRDVGLKKTAGKVVEALHKIAVRA